MKRRDSPAPDPGGGAGARHLVIFDIDGTLTRTNDLDGRCYAQALEEGLGAPIERDWAAYRHVTDAGIAAEAFERSIGRPPDADDLARVRDRFLALLRATREEVFEVPGAAALVRALQGRPGVAVAIATGAWRESAVWKLRRAAVAADGIPMATGDDSPMRDDIIRLAARRAGGPFDRTVYVGDGPWDLAATRRLGIAFVGVAADRDPAVLRSLGAPHVLGDLRDNPAFLSAAGL